MTCTVLRNGLRTQIMNVADYHGSPEPIAGCINTICKQLVDANVGLEKIAALAGHESLDTARLYCEPSLHDLLEAKQKEIDNIMRG